MPAYEILNLRFSAVAGGAVARRRFVKAGANDTAVQAGNGEAAIGVSLNAPAQHEVLELADGIVIVEAGGIIAANSAVQSDANGKAVVRTTGIILGVALTAAGGAGELLAVKTPAISTTANVQLISVDVENVAAGADITARPFFVVPAGQKLTVTAVQVISKGNPAGIDDANTCVVSVEVGADVIATKTYNTANAFPAGGAAGALVVDATKALRAAGQVLTFTLANGATADPDAFTIQVMGVLETA